MITQKEAELIQTIAIALDVDNDEQTTEYVRDNDQPSIMRELRDKFGVKTASGCYRTAFILDNVVVKMSQETDRQDDLVSEAQFIAKMRKDERFARHFPQPEIFTVGNVILQIQEKVDMSHKNRRHMEDEVYELAEALGIDDMHRGNFGWKGPKGKEYPVFVDVDFRYLIGKRKPKKKRSWML